MKNHKRQIARYAFYDQLAMQKHFEKMALEGWLIEKITAYYYQFCRIEPQKLHISITYFPDASEFDPGPTDGQQMLEAFASRDGWKLLTRFGQMQVFCSYKEDPTPLETDVVTQVDTLYRAMKKNWIPSHTVILALSIYQLAFNGYRAFTDIVDFLSTPYLLASLPVWMCILLAEVNELITCFRWYRQAKPAAQNDIFIPVKTNRLITFTLLLSSVFVLISTLFIPNGLRLIAVFWMFVIIAIIILMRYVKVILQKAGVSRRTNYSLTMVFTAFLTIVALTAMTVYIIRTGIRDGRQPVGSYEVNGWTFDIYDEPMPLYIEDLMEIGDSTWSRERNIHNETILLSKTEYRQNHVKGGPEGLKDLEYTIVDIKIPFLYDTIKQAILNERQDEVHGDFIFTDHYEPVDASVWDATEAYQLHWSGSILNTYLVCWENRIVEIKFYWEPAAEQIARAGEILKGL